jgi:hypothetical protein
VELGGFSEGIGDKLVSGLQFVQDGRFQWHRTEGSRVEAHCCSCCVGHEFRFVLGGAFL